MSLIDDVLEKIFKTLDIMKGFFHVPIDEESRKVLVYRLVSQTLLLFSADMSRIYATLH